MQYLHAQTPAGQPLTAEDIPIWRALKGEPVRDITLVLHPERNGGMWATGSAAPIRTPEGQVVGAVATFTVERHSQCEPTTLEPSSAAIGLCYSHRNMQRPRPLRAIEACCRGERI